MLSSSIVRRRNVLEPLHKFLASRLPFSNHSRVFSSILMFRNRSHSQTS
jgi:hypothetical protein